MGSIVAPTELGDSLDAVTTLLETVDSTDVATIVSELARGLDGLGEELGSSIDAASELAARIDAKQPQINALLADARSLAAELAKRPQSLHALATDGQDVLRTLDAKGDALGELLTGLSELALRGDDLVSAVGDDLDPALAGLERGAGVLHEQLRFLPDFVDGLDAVSALLGTGLLQWNRGDGLWGGIGHGILDFAPCGFVGDASCPPRQGYDG